MKSNNTRKLRVLGALLLVAVLSLAVSPVGAQAAQAAQAAAPAPATWTILVGGQAEVSKQEAGQVGAWQFMRFYPDTLYINVGDTVVWKLNTAQPHTVLFLAGQPVPVTFVPEGGSSQRLLANPLIFLPQGGSTFDGSALTGSGQLGGGPGFPIEYKLTFTKEGTFAFQCGIHPMMTGRIIVQKPGTKYPKTQAQIDAIVATELKEDAAKAVALDPIANQVSVINGPDGTRIYQVGVGYSAAYLSYMRFSPVDLTINLGDTVVWVMRDSGEVHTVTFVSGGKVPDLVIAEPQQNAPPKLVVNPDVLNPAGGFVYSGQGYFNSGLLMGTMAPVPGPRTYALMFNTPGTYSYLCTVHDMMGMQGTITVLPKSAASLMPAEPDSDDSGK